jgi:beta-ketoacyl synthase-like protein
MRAPSIRAIGLLSGWGRGPTAVPPDAVAAAADRLVIGLDRPALDPERFRRSRRECLLGVAAVAAMLEDAGEGPESIAGEGTGLVFVTAAAYAASNREHIEPGGGSVYFPYTTPAAVPAEVAIAYGVTGPYGILIGGPTAGLEAIAHAAGMLEAGGCRRALVLGVEIFEECADLFVRGGRLSGPLVETAACLWLEPGTGTMTLERHRGRRGDLDGVRRRLGEMWSCEPLAALALHRAAGRGGPLAIDAAWRGETARLSFSEAPYRDARRRVA